MDLEQPSSGETTQATKQCWSCESTIPYDLGFCAVCWKLVSPADGEVYNASFRCTSTIGGAIRLALARHIANLRRPKVEAKTYTPVARLPRARLPDISLTLDDLEL